MKINVQQLNGLLESLADADAGARQRAAASLAKYTGAEWEGSPDAVTTATDAMVRALPRMDPLARVEATRALGNIGTRSPSVIPELLRLLGHDDDQAVRAEAARALGKIGDGAATAANALASALTDLDGGDVLRGEAARALARVVPRSRSTAEALATAADDPSGHVGVCAAESLWRVSGSASKAVSSLAGRLTDPAVREAAAQALYRIGTPAQEAVPVLLEVAQSKDRLFREVVHLALMKISPAVAAKAGLK